MILVSFECYGIGSDSSSPYFVNTFINLVFYGENLLKMNLDREAFSSVGQ